MGTLHGFCKAKAKDLDSFLGRLVDHDITADNVATVKELRDALKDQFKRTHDKWEALSTADADPFKDDDEYNKCKADYDESKLILDKHWDAAQSTLDRALTTGGGIAQPEAAGGAMKIDEILKPQELLSSEMTLEEADQWFESYKAFISFNKRSMNRLEISVRRALLNKCLDPKMVSTLRTHKNILPTTEIDAPNGCLVRLREIFLEKNPLWLRRHGYFQCIQDESETVEEWWSRKLDKARECQLERITLDEIGMLELIRGIESQTLRQDFLKHKDHT